jgi:aminomethyltransferase
VLRTPFYKFHTDHGGKMVDFAGWELPILYRSIHEEHELVRTAAGIFDVSHMGRVFFGGRHARRLLERVCTRRVSDMATGQCRYSLVCNESGGVKDDVIIYRFDDRWLMVCNAANREKLLAHFEAVKGDLAVKIDDQTQKTGMVAIQGPRVMEFVGRFSKELPTLKRYTFVVKNLLVLKMICSRTGYTGEDGLEVILPANMVGMAMKLLLREGEDGKQVVQPCGLGARDTLRMEAGMPLYGHELTEEIDPLTAGLDFAVSLDKDQDDQFGPPETFIGCGALKKIAAEGPTKKLVGLKLDGKRTARAGMAVHTGDKTMVAVGHVTSACMSPTLGYPIALALLDSTHAQPGTAVQVDFSPAAVAAEVVPLPFYKRS